MLPSHELVAQALERVLQSALFKKADRQSRFLRYVVEKQLAAFRLADYSSAYRQAASGVQQKFTLPQFEAMIRRDYGDMTNAQRIEFGFVKVSGSAAVVQVFFCGASGTVRAFLYSLIAEGDSWKINGVKEMSDAPSGRGLHA